MRKLKPRGGVTQQKRMGRAWGAHQLGDLGQAPRPLWAFTSLPVKWERGLMIKDRFSSDLLKQLGSLFSSLCSSSHLITFKVPTKCWALCRFQPHRGKEVADHPCLFRVPALFPQHGGHPAPCRVTQATHLHSSGPSRPLACTREYFPP